MSRDNLSNAVNKLGVCVAEKGLTPAKKALLAEVRADLASAIESDPLSQESEDLAFEALTHATFALDCANNDMSGSGGLIKTSQQEQKLNEPFHTQKAFDLALEAIKLPESESTE